MQITTSNYTPVSLYKKTNSKNKTIKVESKLLEAFIAPFCTNKAGEKSPKTDLQLLLNASCDCVWLQKCLINLKCYCLGTVLFHLIND